MQRSDIILIPTPPSILSLHNVSQLQACILFLQRNLAKSLSSSFVTAIGKLNDCIQYARVLVNRLYEFNPSSIRQSGRYPPLHSSPAFFSKGRVISALQIVCIELYTHARARAHTHTHIYLCMCACVFDKFMHLSICVWMNVGRYVCAHLCLCQRTRVLNGKCISFITRKPVQ